MALAKFGYIFQMELVTLSLLEELSHFAVDYLV